MKWRESEMVRRRNGGGPNRLRLYTNGRPNLTVSPSHDLTLSCLKHPSYHSVKEPQ
jgi:hypothetical protein